MNLITQSRAAEIVGVKQPVIARYISRGNITKYDGGKVDLDEILAYRDNQTPVMNKSVDNRPEQPREKKSMPAYSESRASREFYQAKLSQMQVMEKNALLIPIADVKSVLDKIASPFSKHLDELPFALKSRYPDIKDEAFDWLKEHINSIKMDFQGIYD